MRLKTISKNILVGFILVFLSGFITGCLSQNAIENLPQRKGSVWRDNDSSLTFTVERFGHGYGQLITEDGVIDVVVNVHPSMGFQVLLLDTENKSIITDEDFLVRGSIVYLRHNKFKIEIKESLYYRVGQKLIFQCIDEAEISD